MNKLAPVATDPGMAQAAEQAAEQVAGKAAEKAAGAATALIESTRNVAAQVDDLTRRGIDRARQVKDDLRVKVGDAGDRTVAYIKDEPVKSVMIAALTGAALAALIGWVARSRSRD